MILVQSNRFVVMGACSNRTQCTVAVVNHGFIFQVLDRALKILDEMPREYKDFYARRMVVRIQNKAFTQDS